MVAGIAVVAVAVLALSPRLLGTLGPFLLMAVTPGAPRPSSTAENHDLEMATTSAGSSRDQPCAARTGPPEA